VVFGDVLVALFAFPRALKNPCYLFEYSGHLCFDGNLVTHSFLKTVRDNRATTCPLDNSNAADAREFHLEGVRSP